MSIRVVLGSSAIVVAIAGCRSHDTPRLQEAQLNASLPTAHVPQGWLGRWDGPEGTFLDISRAGTKYVVIIQDLDGPKTFYGVDDSGRIRFVRSGIGEVIYSGDGRASGMKWLADKKHCLMTRPGEGWCRD